MFRTKGRRMNKYVVRSAWAVVGSVEHPPRNAGARCVSPVGWGAVRRTAAAMAVALAVTLAAGRGRAQEVCVGDCTNAGQVTVADMVLGVNIVLGIDPASVCPNFQNAQG